MPPNETETQQAPADAAPQAENASVTSGAGDAVPVVDESAPKADAAAGTVAAVTETSADAAPQPKAGEPPAQAGDESETHVAKAVPVLLPSEEQAKQELAANPARVSVMSSEGLVVREG